MIDETTLTVAQKMMLCVKWAQEATDALMADPTTTTGDIQSYRDDMAEVVAKLDVPLQELARLVDDGNPNLAELTGE